MDAGHSISSYIPQFISRDRITASAGFSSDIPPQTILGRGKVYCDRMVGYTTSISEGCWRPVSLGSSAASCRRSYWEVPGGAAISPGQAEDFVDVSIRPYAPLGCGTLPSRRTSPSLSRGIVLRPLLGFPAIYRHRPFSVGVRCIVIAWSVIPPASRRVVG